MENASSVSHQGVIEKITDEAVTVRFVAHSACSACHAKGVCSLSNSEEKIVEVPGEGTGYHIGEQVEVLLHQRQGFKAVAFGYVFPLIVVLVVLVLSISLTRREGLSALLSLGILIPYYLLLWLFRKKISRSIVFRLKKAE